MRFKFLLSSKETRLERDVNALQALQHAPVAAPCKHVFRERREDEPVVQSLMHVGGGGTEGQPRS
jgi:hypothetical protein